MSKRCDACGCIHTGDYAWANWRRETASWVPAPDAQQRYTPFGEQQPSVFLGNWGTYDVWTYKSGITLVANNGLRTGYFPLMGIAPIEQGRVWIDGAARCRTVRSGIQGIVSC